MAIEAINENSFDEETAGGLVMVDFWAPWCAPCRMVAPLLDELQKEMKGKVKIVKLNVDENPETASRLGVTTIPTILIFKNGEEVERSVGSGPKDHYQQLIKTHL